MYKKLKLLLGVTLSLLFTFFLIGCSDSLILSENLQESNGETMVLDIFEALQDNEALPFVLTKPAKNMLLENSGLFLKNDINELDTYTDYTLDYRTIMKNINLYGDRLMYIPEAYVLSIYESTIGEKTLTVMQIVGADEKDYCIYGLTSYDNIYEDDIVECYALPLGDTSFENVGGGTTLAVVLAGCYVNKVDY